MEKRIARVSTKDIAREAGVSISTVSKILNNDPGLRVSDEVRARVESVARKNDFHPSALARSLRNRRSMSIALIIPGETNPHYWGIMRSIEYHADLLGGYTLQLGITDYELDRERKYLKHLKEQRTDGCIIQISHPEDMVPEFKELVQSGRSIITLAGPYPELDAVMWDLRAGVEQAMDYLFSQGHERIGFIQGTARPEIGSGKIQGYTMAHERRGVQVDENRIAYVGPSSMDGYRGLRLLLDLPHAPTAVLCSNDVIAIGALRAAHDAGLSIPGDLSIMGMDDIEFASMTIPPLSTIRVDTYQIGRYAVELLLERMKESKHAPIRHIMLGTELVIRESTGPPSKRAL